MTIEEQDIEYFNNVSSRSNNDIANQKREDPIADKKVNKLNQNL